MSKAGQRATLVELRGVRKRFESASGSFTALDELSFAAYPGELVAIVGRSGSGKSTLLNIVAGIDRPTQGEVIVCGQSLGELGESRLAAWRGRAVGVVFQSFELLPTLTVLENVMLPMDFAATYAGSAARARALELLASVGIANQAGKLPAALSGGEQQRAAIARALANDPPLIVADEPTGNLDSQAAAAVLDLLAAQAANGKTVLMVTHERDIAARVQRVVTLVDGKLQTANATRAAS